MEEPSRISSVDIAWSMSGNDLDVTYKTLRSDVENRCRIIDKGLRVRIQAWIAKLDEEANGILWKRNRNSYAKLLQDQLKLGRVEEPFDVMPPSGQLPMIPKALVYRYSSNSVKSKQNNHSRLSPSQELDQYLASCSYSCSTPAAPVDDIFASVPSEFGSTSLDTVSGGSRQSELELRLSQAESQLESCTQLLEACLVRDDDVPGEGTRLEGVGMKSEERYVKSREWGYDGKTNSAILHRIENYLARGKDSRGSSNQNRNIFRNEDELTKRLDRFQQETNKLMTENVVPRSYGSQQLDHTWRGGQEFEELKSCTAASPSYVGLPVRHTMKSAAAAHARLSGSCKKPSGSEIGGKFIGNTFRSGKGAPHITLMERDPLSALVADVSAIKSKIASSLAELENCSKYEDIFQKVN